MPTEKQYTANSPHWYGLHIKIGACVIFLYDHRDTEEEWKGAATIDVAGKVTRANVAKHPFADCVRDFSSKTTHAIIHFDNPHSLYAATDEYLIVLRVSTIQAAPNGHEILTSPANIIQFSMQDGNAYRSSSPWLKEFFALDYKTAESIAKLKHRSQAAAYEEKYGHFLDIILPGRVENLLAFRLLCEAVKVVEEENTKRTAKSEQTSNTAELCGITIHAPEQLEQWLAPFGKKPEDVNAIEHVAGMIGSGDLKKAAEKVLKTVKERNNPSSAITGFLEAVESPNP